MARVYSRPVVGDVSETTETLRVCKRCGCYIDIGNLCSYECDLDNGSHADYEETRVYRVVRTLVSVEDAISGTDPHT